MPNSPRIVFFGTPDLTLSVLDALEAADYTPELIVTAPDRPSGRKQHLTPPPAKVWATARNIPVYQPERSEMEVLATRLEAGRYDVAIVFAYGQILPRTILDLPRRGTINLHPSLLPQLRGPSPIRSAILTDQRTTGVTVMEMDEQMDHGPIIAQREVVLDEAAWPPYGPELDQLLIQAGAEILVEILPAWLAGTITPTPQEHEAATYCYKLTRTDGELQIDPHNLPTGDTAYQTLLKIRGLAGWPGTFFIHNDTRIKITAATLSSDGSLIIERVIPAGKSEMSWEQYLLQI